MDVSISVVSYNTKDLLERCIKSIYKQTKGIKFEIIVVDNGSTDGSPSVISNLIHSTSSGQISNLKFVRNKKNLYFAKANNQALRLAHGKYFLILNSDTYFVDNSLKKMVDFMEKNPEVGACEGLEVYENGKIVSTGSMFSTPLVDFYELSLIGKRLKNKKAVEKYRMTNKNRALTYEIEVGCDAFLCVRTKIMKEMGGYDVRFLLYYTENDICLRIINLGHKIVHLGKAKVIHKVSASVKNIGWRKLDIYYRDLLTYYLKHGYKVSGILLFALLKIEETLLKIFRQETVK